MPGPESAQPFRHRRLSFGDSPVGWVMQQSTAASVDIGTGTALSTSRIWRLRCAPAKLSNRPMSRLKLIYRSLVAKPTVGYESILNPVCAACVQLIFHAYFETPHFVQRNSHALSLAANLEADQFSRGHRRRRKDETTHLENSVRYIKSVSRFCCCCVARRRDGDERRGTCSL
jgi:hypothetical protein